jgi:hypothetical protein
LKSVIQCDPSHKGIPDIPCRTVQLRLKLPLLTLSLISASDVSKKLMIVCPVAEKDGRTFQTRNLWEWTE